MAVVTISRLAGSGAEQIAQRVGELLGYDLLDKQLMAQVAVDVGLSCDEIIDFSETHYKVKSFVERLLHPSPHYVGHVVTRDREASDAGTLSLKQLNESECIELIRSTLRAAYHRGNMVILGRGGQAILQKMPGALHVRVEAPWRARVARIGVERQVAEEEARQLVAERDSAVAEYLERFFGIRGDDPLHYHLVVNTGKWDLETAAQLVVNAVGLL
jgi:cytidylate kinase